MYLAPQNIPSAVVLTLGNKFALYCTVGTDHDGWWAMAEAARDHLQTLQANYSQCIEQTSVSSVVSGSQAVF